MHDAARCVGEHAAMTTAASNASLLDQPLADVSGASASLRNYVGAPVVVVFVRHYGCIFCRERAAEVLSSRSAIESKGARIVFVGTGLPAMASDFAVQQAGGLPVLSDPTRRIFELAGMRRGLSTVLRLKTFLNSWRAFRRGHRQTKVQGDPWQQGGVLVLDKSGAIAHAQRDSAAGDPIDWRRVMDAIPAAR
jgi:peroxiredoxin